MLILRQLAKALLLLGRRWVAKLQVRAGDTAAVARGVEVRVCQHLVQSDDLRPTRAWDVAPTIVDHALAGTTTILSCALGR